MKYQNLYIHFDPSWETFNKVTQILGCDPIKHEKSKFDISDEPSLWWIQLVEDEDKGEQVDFVNIFLDLIEPNIHKLLEIGIDDSQIKIWLVYEYHRQCVIGFNPIELERLEKNGISLNIDCHSANQ